MKKRLPAHGSSLAEYGLILGLIALIAVPLLMSQGQTVSNQMAGTNNQISQLNQLTGLLKAPAQKSLMPATPSQPIDQVNLGETHFTVTQNANGQLAFQQNTPNNATASNNTTSAEGDTVITSIADYLDALAKNPGLIQTDLPPEQLQKLAKQARKIATLESQFDQDKKGKQLFNLVKQTRKYLKLAQGTTNDPVVHHLNQMVLTISHQNYLEPGSRKLAKQYAREKQKMPNISLDSQFRLKTIATTANGQDTHQVANELAQQESTASSAQPPEQATASSTTSSTP